MVTRNQDSGDTDSMWIWHPDDDGSVWVWTPDDDDDISALESLSNGAYTLYIMATQYSNRPALDGFIPEQATRWQRKHAPERIAELVNAGLWEPAEGGYRIRDYRTLGGGR
jgi:hypothetical protein